MLKDLAAMLKASNHAEAETPENQVTSINIWIFDFIFFLLELAKFRIRTFINGKTYVDGLQLLLYVKH